MIGGASWTWWIGFHAAVALLLIIDAFLPTHRHDAPHTQLVAWLWTGFLALASASFAGWIAVRLGHLPALQFVAGYTIETSLSVDNLFVFLILFHGFQIDSQRQHRVLLWGIGGAIVLRALCIFAGVALLNRFEWISYILGAALLYAAFRLMRGSSARAAIPEWIRRMQPAKGSLLPVIVAVEVTDLLFAFDSIPAVLALSRNPFIVYTSNIAAILGLRSLYFAIAALLDRIRYLHYGLAALLAFAALKMLLAHWVEVPLTWSLVVIGAILAICAIVSAAAGKPIPPSQPRKIGAGTLGQ